MWQEQNQKSVNIPILLPFLPSKEEEEPFIPRLLQGFFLGVLVWKMDDDKNLEKIGVFDYRLVCCK